MQNNSLSLADRMKRYENISEWKLPRRIPVILRLDIRAGHTCITKMFGKYYSENFYAIMGKVAEAVQKEIQGCSFAYSQSDEISFLLTDYQTIKTEPWFGYDARKLISISAGLASAHMSCLSLKFFVFDARAFSLPQDEVVNYFIWRQRDATRNAILFAGYEYFSHKQLFEKNCNQIQEMLFQEKGINFNDYSTMRKRGFCVVDGRVDTEIPIFSKDREYVERFVNIRED